MTFEVSRDHVRSRLFHASDVLDVKMVVTV